MVERKSEGLLNKVENFIKIDVPGVVWGVSARIDVFGSTYEDLLMASWAEMLVRGEVSPIRRRALRLLSAEDQASVLDTPRFR